MNEQWPYKWGGVYCAFISSSNTYEQYNWEIYAMRHKYNPQLHFFEKKKKKAS